MARIGLKKIGFISLGCPKNRVDSEVMLGLLADRGYEPTSSEEEAEILVVNTCGFIEPAKAESIQTILELAERKKTGNCKKLVVTGCMVERYGEEIQKEIPEVDAILGVNDLEAIVDVCEVETRRTAGTVGDDSTRGLYLYTDRTPRLLSTPGHYAYLKVAEGCDHTCSFCIIPTLRGPHRSRTPDSIIREALNLAETGVRELNLVSQDTTRYGQDLGLDHGLTQLLKSLSRVDGIEWIRVHYSYPNSLDISCLDAMTREDKICRYLDMPLQHVSASILKAMRRGGNRRSLENMLEMIRRKVPEIALRTTMIVGFPGETDEDFTELLDFCRQMQFEHLGVFVYSDEEGTSAFDLESKIPEEVKKERRRLLMEQQARLSLSKNLRRVGSTLRVLVDGLSEESELILQGRASWQAPEIDGVILITDSCRESLQPGEFYDVKITRALEHDLIGRVVG